MPAPASRERASPGGFRRGLRQRFGSARLVEKGEMDSHPVLGREEKVASLHRGHQLRGQQRVLKVGY